MKIIPESVQKYFRYPVKSFNRRMNHQDKCTPMGTWLSIYCNNTLENLLQHFRKIQPVPNANNKLFPKRDLQEGYEDQVNDQQWDKDHIADIEG